MAQTKKTAKKSSKPTKKTAKKVEPKRTKKSSEKTVKETKVSRKRTAKQMRCRHEDESGRCANRSRGPRYHYLCTDHDPTYVAP